MACVEKLVADPWGICYFAGNFFHLHVVVVPAIDPLLDTQVEVDLEGVLVPAPHLRYGVIAPPFRLCSLKEDIEDLMCFNSLLAKSTVIKGFEGCSEVAVGKEGLQMRLLFDCYNLL